MNKFLGFTLSEVLITLGVLGVISAITLPNLALNYKGQVLEQQFRSTYSDVKHVVMLLGESHGVDWATYTTSHCGRGEDKEDASKCVDGSDNNIARARDFMSKLNGGNQYKSTSGTTDTQQLLKELYRNNVGQLPFSQVENSDAEVSDICQGAGVWIDSKGRFWTFDGSYPLICVDINGSANPNRYNIDIFAFAVLNATETSNLLNGSDTEGDEALITESNNRNASVYPCDIELVRANYKQKKYTKKEAGACPYTSPIENTAPVGKKSSKGKEMTATNNYWRDYIDYK